VVGTGSNTVDGKRLLVLGAGPAQLGLLRSARERGCLVIACDRDPGAPGFRYANRRAILSAEDETGIERLARAAAVQGLIAPGIDWPVAVAARIAARLRLPHPLGPETAAVAVSKLRQRMRFAEAGVPQPRWQLVRSSEEELEVGPPCVVKPPDRQGQRGLSVVGDAAGLPRAIELALDASRSGTCLVEELVEGPEITVNAFSAGGRFHPLTVTDRLTAEPPAFGVALAHAWPSAVATQACTEAARAAAETVGIHEGPTYTQLRIGPDGPRVVELAARLGGGHDAELCQAALGVDLNGLALGAAFGEPAEEPAPNPVGGACVSFLVPPEGILRAVEGLDEAAAVDGVLDVAVYREPGWTYGLFRGGSDRAGYVLARGESRDDALERANRAAKRIRFETVDVEAPAQRT
jgi:biotin carboxylase